MSAKRKIDPSVQNKFKQNDFEHLYKKNQPKNVYDKSHKRGLIRDLNINDTLDIEREFIP